MKKLLALALTLALCLGLAAPALALEYGQEYAGYTTGSSQQYRDVPDTHWAFQSIATCSQRSWFNGYPDGTFRPEGLITREEAAKVFAVAMSLEIETNPTVTYTDTANNWAKAYIEATKPLFPNVANLQGTASFRPTQTITREETIYALVVAWGYGSKTKNADLSVLNMFSDTSSVSAGVKPYLAVAVAEGLVSGLPDGTIAAQKGLTRAEFATLLARALSHGYGDTKQEFQAPKITLDKYSATTDKTSLTVTGTVTPADATVTLDGNDVRVSKGSFSVELELKVGVNSFTLTAENAYGTKDSKTIAVERTDQLAISINSFEAKTEAEEVTLTGTVTPPAGVTLTVDGNEVPTTSTGAFNVTLPLEVGANVFEFAAKNTNGSTATKSVKITREFVAPTSEPETTTQPSADSAEGSSSKGDASGRKVIETSGCGDNLVWTLYEDGEMVISGTGKMSDYTNVGMNAGWNCSPWANHIDKITTVTIEKGVTSIGGSAFEICKNLSKVTIPDGVTHIGTQAFSGCESLKDIKIPKSVVSFGRQNAFAGCAFTEITIPAKIETIPFGTFQNCKNLTKVTMPDRGASDPTVIGDSAFARCTSLSKINLGNVASIGERAFEESGLTAVDIYTELNSLGAYAFMNCKKLEKINLWCNSPSWSSWDTIFDRLDYAVFAGCESLKEVQLPQVKTIGSSAFSQCYNLMIVHIPNTVTTIENRAFLSCPQLSTVYAADRSKINIGDYNDDLLSATWREW